jgi:hypothetical protein
MEILYGTTMAAVFVLCLALLWTTRRILQSSPLTSGELSLIHADETTDRSELTTQPNFVEIALSQCEPDVAEISPSLIDHVALEMMAAEERIEEPIQAPAQTMELPAMDAHLTQMAESSEVPAQPVERRGAQTTNRLPHGYNYLLEGLLLGVSVFVLLRTQRSSARHRSLMSSDQVA